MNDQAPKKNPLSLSMAADRNGPSPGTLRDRVRSLRLSDQVTHGGGGGGSWLPWVLALLFASSTAYLGVQLSSVPSADASSKSEADKLIEEQTRPGQLGSAGEVVFEAKGNVVPFEQILVSPLSGGILKELYIFEGMKVKKGDLLGRIDDTEYRAKYNYTRARLAEAKKKLEEMVNGNRPQEIDKAEADWNKAKAEHKRMIADHQRNLNAGIAVTKADLDKSKAEQDAQKAVVDLKAADLSLMREGTRKERIAQGEAVVDQLQAELDEQNKHLNDCQIERR